MLIDRAMKEQAQVFVRKGSLWVAASCESFIRDARRTYYDSQLAFMELRRGLPVFMWKSDREYVISFSEN